MPSLSLSLAQVGTPAGVFWMVLVIVAAITLLIILATFGQFLRLWIQALTSGARIGFLDLVRMRLRRVDPRVVTLARIRACRAGLNVTTAQFEAHYLAGGRVSAVVIVMIAVRAAGSDLSWDELCADELARRNVNQEVGALAKAKGMLGKPACRFPFN